MTTEDTVTPEESEKSVLEMLYLQNAREIILTLICIALGISLFLGLSTIQMPFIMISFFALGLAPAYAIIAVSGAIRGPIAGFLVGFLGKLFTDLFLFGIIPIMGLPALAYGVLGLIVGLAIYDFGKGRSLAKMAILSMIGLVFTLMLVVVIGLLLGDVAILVLIGFQLLPELTLGLPSVFLLTPIFARIWVILKEIVPLPW
ncbi:MAG: ECF transporter S component [Candidatus Thorarchaeota archaeon]